MIIGFCTTYYGITRHYTTIKVAQVGQCPMPKKAITVCLVHLVTRLDWCMCTGWGEVIGDSSSASFVLLCNWIILVHYHLSELVCVMLLICSCLHIYTLMEVANIQKHFLLLSFSIKLMAVLCNCVFAYYNIKLSLWYYYIICVTVLAHIL